MTSQPVLSSLRKTAADYVHKLALFRPNARFYLIYMALNGAAFGIYRLLFNFYVLSFGYNEALLGRLLTTVSLVQLVSALPAGYLSDRIGRKPSLVISATTTVAALLGMVIWPTTAGFYAMSVLMGLAQSLGAVTYGPFLMENSDDEERTYLFSISSGMNMIAHFMGNWLGGHLPAMIGAQLGVSATGSTAYGGALVVVALLGSTALLPMLFIRRQRKPQTHEGYLSPIAVVRSQPGVLLRLILPMWVTSLGAGLLMPFMNIFFRHTYGSSDATIGALFAVGSLFMALGLLVAPPLADRYGKMTMVIVTQALSVPFLFVMGFVPWFWMSAAAYLIRLALMNMSNPVYQAFVMEHAAPESRATVASLVSMSWSFGWAFSPTLSGWLQVNYGFTPVYAGTLISYIVAIYLYWRFFGLRRQSKLVPVEGTPSRRTV
jgi:MFS family permease